MMLFDNSIEMPEELVDLDEEAFQEKYQKICCEMIKKQKWYKLDGSIKGHLLFCSFSVDDFTEIQKPYNLALGRSDYYDKFIKDLEKQTGFTFYQSDYMVWIEPLKPYRSLLFYIDTAESIHFSLEGVSASELITAINPGKAMPDRRSLKTKYMTTWEINQVLFSKNRMKAIWHLRGNNSDTAEIRKILSAYVDKEKVVNNDETVCHSSSLL